MFLSGHVFSKSNLKPVRQQFESRKANPCSIPPRSFRNLSSSIQVSKIPAAPSKSESKKKSEREIIDILNDDGGEELDAQGGAGKKSSGSAHQMNSTIKANEAQSKVQLIYDETPPTSSLSQQERWKEMQRSKQISYSFVAAEGPIPPFATPAWSNFVLKLYRSIRRAHVRKLPAFMRTMGDMYVSEEWRLHKKADPNQVSWGRGIQMNQV